MIALAALLLLTATPEPRRIAVLVGSNAAAEGRAPLRFAHKDAERMAAVLREAGRFKPADVLLLKDPAPEALLAAIDAALAQLAAEPGDTLFLLYYSGHSDQSAVYPGGTALPLEQLRTRLDSPSATVRIGVIDACRGGAWTRAKGLSPDAPFLVDVPFGLASQGSVLISSSSGAENAHESDALQGSFFTHHLVAGMRGPADRSGDGEVSLTEAFGYAQELTVRDSALQAQVPQHPSFDMKLHGRTDLGLTRAASAPSVVAVTQIQGPIEIVQLQTGIVVIELREGARELQVALPPGKYLFRRRGTEGIYGREVVVAPNSSVPLNEASLTLIGQPELASKGIGALRGSNATTLPAHTIEIRGSLGLLQDTASPQNGVLAQGSRLDVGFDLTWALTDRLQVAPLGLTYRFGERGHREIVPYAAVSLTGFNLSNAGNDVTVAYSAGVGARFWVSDRHAINAAAGVRSVALYGDRIVVHPTDITATASAGYSGFFLNGRLSVNAGLSYGQFVLKYGSGPRGFGSEYSAPLISIGSVQRLGLRRLPLLGVQITDWLAVEAHSVLTFNPYSAYGTPLGLWLTVGAAFTF